MLTTALDRPFPYANILALDLETTGLSPTRDQIITITVSDGTDARVFDVRGLTQESVRGWILEHLFDRRLILHNAAFDLVFLNQHYGVGYPAQVFDTMLAEQLLTAGLELSASLKETAMRRLGLELDKSLQTSFTLEGDLTDEQVDYAAYDVIPLPTLARLQQEELNAHALHRVWEIESRALKVFANMWYEGICVDLPYLERLIFLTTEQRDAIAEDLQEKLTLHVMSLRIAKRDQMQWKLDEWMSKYNAAVAEYEALWAEHLVNCAGSEAWIKAKWDDTSTHKASGQPNGQRRYVREMVKEWRKTNPRPAMPRLDERLINLNSTQQKLAALGSMGLRLDNLQSNTLLALLPNLDPVMRDEVVLPLMRYTKAEKLITSFGQSLIESIDERGRVHGSVRQIGTATGRPTMSSPNLLQIPSDNKTSDPERQFRRVFVAGQNKVLIACDYSQMELRIIAQLSEDERMREAFLGGYDLHTYTAATMFGVPLGEVKDHQRKTAKTLNFGISYGMGVNKLRATLAAEGIFMSQQDAADALDGWKSTYPQASQWLLSKQANTLSNGFAVTPLGRKRFFDLTESYRPDEAAKIKRRGANHVIQGTNADITKLAMILISENLEGRGNLLLNVYDETVTEVDTSFAQEAFDLVVASMVTAGETVLTDVPVSVDGVISRSWSEYDKVDV